ncbi:MAG: hypothetical protein ACLRIO_05405, partial [Butyricicoccus sp.]
MKKRNNRFLAGTLAGLMMLTMLPVTALAAQEGADDDAASDTSNNIVNVVSDGENGQQAVNNNVNIAANGGNENTQKSADDSSGDTENVQESADDSNGGSDDTAAANQQEGEVGGSGSNGEPAPTPPPAEEPFVAKIGTQTYDTLDEAIAEVKDNEVIDVVDDCELTVGTIEKTVVINGNGHTISIPDQVKGNNALNINASLTFNKANVVFTNAIDNVNQWSATMNSDGVLTLDKGSTCTIETHGIYATPNAVINVKGASKLNIKNTTYTAMMAEKYAELNVEAGSKVVVDHAYNNDGVPNGINNFKIKVEDSTLIVTNCEKQGLVRCWLTLNNSNAEISGNDTGMTGFKNTDVLTMENGSTLTMENNHSAGIFLWGGKVDVQDGNTLTITGTGDELTDDEYKENSHYLGALAVYYYYNTYKADVNFADGATVN